MLIKKRKKKNQRIGSNGKTQYDKSRFEFLLEKVSKFNIDLV